ncbi:MAG: S41 family peptidase [Pseudomonadota bacterium]
MKFAAKETLAGAGLLIGLTTLTAWGGGGGSDRSTPSPAPVTTQSQLQGQWEKRGYGLVLDISGTVVTSYDVTTQTCAQQPAEALSSLTSQLEGLSTDGSAFTLRAAPTGFTDRYDKIASLPTLCENPIGTSPTELFEHVWHTFNEYYAFFEERGVDWLAQYDAIRPTVHDGMSDEALFAALTELVQPIDDVHVSITANDQVFSPGAPRGFFDDFRAEFEAQNELTSLEAYFSQELNRALAIVDEVYLQDDFVEAGGPSDDFFKWGRIGDDIGYVFVGAFILQLDRPIAAQLQDIERVLDQALADLQDTQAIIVDVRLAPGGADPIAIAMANRFADMRRLALRKYTRTIEGDGRIQDVSLEPFAGVTYGNPVAVLTSGFSASATEVFSLAMRALPQVTLVGEPTIGALSDILEKPLPNGWQVELANEVYTDADGLAYEVTGVPPHLEVAAYGYAERQSDQDSALNAALTELGLSPGQFIQE